MLQFVRTQATLTESSRRVCCCAWILSTVPCTLYMSKKDTILGEPIEI